MNRYEVLVPKETVSDDRVTVVSWLVQQGAAVARGAVVAEVETSKEVIEIQAGADGAIHFIAEPGAELAIGACLAYISTAVGGAAPGPLIADSGGPAAPAPAPAPSGGGYRDAPVVPEGVRLSQSAARLLALDPSLAGNLPQRGLVTAAGLSRAVSLDLSRAAVLVGGGRQAAAIIDTVNAEGRWTVIGCVDGRLPLGTRVNGVPVIGTDDSLDGIRAQGVAHAIIGVGGANAKLGLRWRIYEAVKARGFTCPAIKHPSAVVEPSAELEEGAIVLPLAYVGTSVRVGRNCLINVHAVLSHDTVVGAHTHVAPGAVVAGSVSIGANCLIGMGATIKFGLAIGDGVLVYNSARVLKDVAASAIVKS